MTDAIVLATQSTPLCGQWEAALQDAAVVEIVDDFRHLHKTLENYDEVIAILDLNLPGLDGYRGIQKLLATAPDVKIIAASDTENEKEISALFIAGVKGICRQDMDSRLLQKAVQKVCDHEVWLERRLIGPVLSEIGKQRSGAGGTELDQRRSPLSGLTAREREIAILVSNGLCQKAITKRLVISEHTVRNHLSNIFRKTGVSSRLQLALIVKGGTHH